MYVIYLIQHNANSESTEQYFGCIISFSFYSWDGPDDGYVQ